MSNLKMVAYRLEYDDADILDEYCATNSVEKTSVLTELIRSLPDEGPRFLERARGEQARRYQQTVQKRIDAWGEKK
jgi:hypothetical protein